MNIPNESGYYWIRYTSNDFWEICELDIDDTGNTTIYLLADEFSYNASNVFKWGPKLEPPSCQP